MTRNQLKLLALVAMFADHFTYLFFPGLSTHPVAIAGHVIGRLTAPLMWWFIAEGMRHTRDQKSYLKRLGVFAIVSIPCYWFAFGLVSIDRLGAILPLWCGAMLIALDGKLQGWKWVGAFAGLYWLGTFGDYGSVATLIILAMYRSRNDRERIRALGIGAMIYSTTLAIGTLTARLGWIYGLVQFASLVTIPLLTNRDTRPQPRSNNFFYWAYPAHLLILGALRLIIHGNIPIL